MRPWTVVESRGRARSQVPGLFGREGAGVDYPEDRFRREADLLDGVRLTGGGRPRVRRRLGRHPDIASRGLAARERCRGADGTLGRRGFEDAETGRRQGGDVGDGETGALAEGFEVGAGAFAAADVDEHVQIAQVHER